MKAAKNKLIVILNILVSIIVFIKIMKILYFILYFKPTPLKHINISGLIKGNFVLVCPDPKNLIFFNRRHIVCKGD